MHTIKVDSKETGIPMSLMELGQIGKIVCSPHEDYKGRVVMRLNSSVVDLRSGDVWRNPIPDIHLVSIYPKGTKIEITVD